MKKLATVCSLITILGISSNASAMDHAHCIDVIKVTSDLQLAIIGSSDLDQAISNMEAVRDKTPDMQKELNALMEVAKMVDPKDPASLDDEVMASFDQADMNFNEKYEKLCGEY